MSDDLGLGVILQDDGCWLADGRTVTRISREAATMITDHWKAKRLAEQEAKETRALASHTMDPCQDRCTACGADRDDIEDQYSPNCLGSPDLERERRARMREEDQARVAAFKPIIGGCHAPH